MEKASKKHNSHYNKSLKSLAQVHRRNMTKSAACLWKYVLGQKQMMGYQFRRERPILNYIVDFACLELMLIIEVDGWTHDEPDAINKDKVRDEALEDIGFKVLRFSSWEVLNRINDVSIIIREWIEKHTEVEPVGHRRRKY